MLGKSWFDPDHNALMFMEYQQKMESWLQATQDGRVDQDEIANQAKRVTSLLEALEPKLSDEMHAELTTIFHELAVLYGLQQIYELQDSEEQ